MLWKLVYFDKLEYIVKIPVNAKKQDLVLLKELPSSGIRGILRGGVK